MKSLSDLAFEQLISKFDAELSGNNVLKYTCPYDSYMRCANVVNALKARTISVDRRQNNLIVVTKVG